MYILEACVVSLQQALAAEKQGANRLELCVDLHLDGLTPPMDFVADVMKAVKIPVRVMVRPRAGDYFHTPDEIARIKKSIVESKNLGAEGVVIGMLTKENQVDIAQMNELCALARPMKVTFHKAIEAVPDKLLAAKQLMESTTVDSILTSGGSASPLQSIPLLKEMMRICAKHELIICGGVTNKNFEEVHAIFQAKAYHGKKIVGELPGQ